MDWKEYRLEQNRAFKSHTPGTNVTQAQVSTWLSPTIDAIIVDNQVETWAWVTLEQLAPEDQDKAFPLHDHSSEGFLTDTV